MGQKEFMIHNSQPSLLIALINQNINRSERPSLVGWDINNANLEWKGLVDLQWKEKNFICTSCTSPIVTQEGKFQQKTNQK